MSSVQVLWYLLEGGRLIDTAHIYGNHRAIGDAIREAGRRGVPRSEVFLVKKKGDFHSIYYHIRAADTIYSHIRVVFTPRDLSTE